MAVLGHENKEEESRWPRKTFGWQFPRLESGFAGNLPAGHSLARHCSRCCFSVKYSTAEISVLEYTCYSRWSLEILRLSAAVRVSLHRRLAMCAATCTSFVTSRALCSRDHLALCFLSFSTSVAKGNRTFVRESRLLVTTCETNF